MDAAAGGSTRNQRMGGASWNDFMKAVNRTGHGREDAGFKEYERETKERVERKLNWNIKNRWEQRALDDVVQNLDVRQALFRDFTRLSQQ